jgi:hypothetical protein
MPTNDEELLDDPLIEPRLIRRLRDRPRAVDFGFRDELLAQLDEVICDRRRPDNVAEQGVLMAFDRIQEAGGKVAKRRASNFLQNRNTDVLENL